MAIQFTTAISGAQKITGAIHQKWGCAVITNGCSWPIAFGSSVQSASDLYRLGIIPTFTLATPTTTTSGTSTAGTYGIRIVYRSSKFIDGVTGDQIQGNGSNIVDVTLGAGDAVVLTKALPTPTDSKIDAIDIYAASKIGATYSAFYKVVSGCANSAGTVTFNIQVNNTYCIGVTPSEGTAVSDATILATDNDWAAAKPIIVEMDGRAVLVGGLNFTVTGDWVNGSSTVDTAERIYNGIEFWYARKNGDTSGGIDGRGTYLCRYASESSFTLVNADGTATTYSGTTSSADTYIWTDSGRIYSKLFNPHAYPLENLSSEYASKPLAAARVPNTHRLLIFGRDWVVAEDYDNLPISGGLNYLSTEWGCSSNFSIVAARGRLYWIDLGANKRQICMTDGTSVSPISTQKIKSVLDRVTLDSNGDVYRIHQIHGAYYATEEVIRWGLYLDNNTVANFVLELDLVTGDIRGDPQFYAHRYLDAFTFGVIRNRNYVGQFGSTALACSRLGMDNVKERYYDWADATTTLRGDLATAGNTTTTVNIASGALTTTGSGVKGIQLLLWQENDANGLLVANPTFYHCRVLSNTATAMTIDYVETMSVDCTVSNVGVALPSAPSGTGWKWALGGIQAIIGPKWFTSRDDKTKGTFREMAVIHHGQALLAAENPIRAQSFENFDSQPKEAQYLEEAQDGQQVADATKFSASFSRPGSNPVAIMGFSLIDNNVNREKTALSVESIILQWNDALPQQNNQQ